MSAAKLTQKQRQDLFDAEMVLSRVGLHLKQRISDPLPKIEREGVKQALVMVWTLYRLAWKEQQA